MHMTGGQALARQLVRQGIEDVFGIPGVRRKYPFKDWRQPESPMRCIRTKLAIAALLFAASASLLAQGYPQGPITIVLTAGPGDGSDTTMRMMAEDLRKSLKVPVLLVNKPGAGGVLAVDSVVRANKDGYTLLLTNNAPLTFRPAVEPATTRYDPLKDLVPLGMVSRTPFLLAVGKEAPYKDFAQLIAYAKQHPGGIRIATVGTGSVGDFTIDAINSLTGAGLTTVAYKGATPAVMAVSGGHVEGTAITMSAVIGQVKSAALRPVVISSKYPEFPDIPTLAELGYSSDLIGVWTGFFAPAGIPNEAKNVLVPALRAAITNPQTTTRLLSAGLVESYSAPDDVVKEMRQEYHRVMEFARRAGLVK